MEESFLRYIEESITKNWDKPALTDYQGASYTYRDVARKIEKLHILFEESGIQKGDKIALCGQNMAQWAIAFLSIVSYGAVAVPILSDFKPDNIHQLVNHSDARMLFAGPRILDNIDEYAMPSLVGIIRISDYAVVCSRNEKLGYARAHLNELFGKKYPERFTSEDFRIEKENLEDLAMINYTSGTSSAPKGVMLPYRSLWTNIKFCVEILDPGPRILMMLPLAHMYGLSIEFLYPFCAGSNIFFLSKAPTPKVLLDAFAEVKPTLIVTVPLVIEKIIRKRVFPLIEQPYMRFLVNIPIVNTPILKEIKRQLRNAFGGEFDHIIIGGAALSRDVDQFLSQIQFPYTVGFGMTECGPLLTYTPPTRGYKAFSCGRHIDRCELAIDNPDPETHVGELITRGPQVMLGYYKNPEETARVLQSDGWLHTGDLGLIDEDGSLFIKGRIKNMILGANGQNIYPEEIESVLNNMPYVGESLIIEHDNRLCALVYPDLNAIHGKNIPDEEVSALMDDNIKQLNKLLPLYSQIARYRITFEEFEKTPKRSIKRYIYQNAFK